MRLITIPFSHYNERARWALQRYGVRFVEHGYLPLFHFVGVATRVGLGGGRADRASSRFSTPALVTDDGDRIRDSGQIVHYASDRFSTAETTLYPEGQRAEIEALERKAHDHIGPHVRRIVYFHLLTDTPLLLRLVRESVGRLQAGAFRVLRPLMVLALRRAVGIDEPRALRSQQRLQEVVAELDERLAGDRQHLVGERFTAADLTVASLLAPVLFPEQYGSPLPEVEALPRGLRELVEQMRATSIGAHAMRLYAEQRHVSVGARSSE